MLINHFSRVIMVIYWNKILKSNISKKCPKKYDNVLKNVKDAKKKSITYSFDKYTKRIFYNESSNFKNEY